MSDTRKILEQGVGTFAPDPGGYERVLGRRSRKRRNERIATIFLALAITIALIAVGTKIRYRDASIPVSLPKVGAVARGLSLVNPDTGTITPLSQVRIAQTLNGLDISPDGSEIAFTRRVSGRYGFQIFVMGADGGGIRQLTDQPLGAYAPAWSPSGDRIAFISYTGKDSGGGDLFVMDADGSSVRLVTRTKHINERDVAWSPDGSRLAFEAYYLRGGYRIGITDVRTGATSRISGSGSAYALLSQAVEPAWSPDGNWIAFEGAGEPGIDIGRIWLMHPDGTDAHVLVGVMGVPPDDSSPKWSPDGRQIAYCQSIPDNGRSSIASVDVATGTVRVVTTNSTCVFDWSPRGYLVVLGWRG
jgi:Tol biopolymer transport system component